MTELLRKWAQHEPERCSFDGDTCRLAWRLDEPGDTTKAEMNNAMTLAAVIEAIEARGWDCRLTSSQRRAGEWHAIVWRHGEPQPTFRPSLDGFAPTPAAALLTAYVAALSAEEGTNP